MKKFETNKLFYSKYPYKLACYNNLAFLFRGADLSYIRKRLDALQQQYNETKTISLHNIFLRDKPVSVIDLYNSQKIFNSLCNNKNYRVRAEQGNLCVYSEDKEWLYELVSILNGYTEWWEPTRKLEQNTIVMTEAMSDWKYRIKFGSKRVPLSFRDWCYNNKDNLRMGPTFINQLSNDARGSLYLDNLYFYIKSEKMLTLVELLVGNCICRVDKIVIETKNV